MLILSDDILLLLWQYYMKNNIKCIKNSMNINNFFVCKKMYDIFKKNKEKIIKWDCELLNIDKLDNKICHIHDEIGINFINNLIGQIEKYISLQNSPICDAYGINFHKYHVNNFIHCLNLQKNEEIVKQILAKYNLKIMRYCCGGDGCELRQIKKK